jgi:membrane associated rhomboid family serine protease
MVMVRTLFFLNIAGFLAQIFYGDFLLTWFALWPPGPDAGPHFMPWQLVSYSFLHGGILHLGVNMLALWMFGRDVERVLGSRRFLQYYIACVVSAALLQLLVAYAGATPYPTVGASGGVFGLLLAYGLFFPYRRLMLLFPPIPMPAWLFVSLYAALELVLGVTGTQAGVAHFAHLGGMLGGYLLLQLGRKRPR